MSRKGTLIPEMIVSLLIYTGYIPALIISLFKKMGDGTGNESGMAEFFRWAMGFGVVIWILAIIGSLWSIHVFHTAG